MTESQHVIVPSSCLTSCSKKNLTPCHPFMFCVLLHKQVLLFAVVCEIILPGPEAAARAAAAASNKKRNEAEAAIADAVSRALHMLGSLKQIVSLLAGQP